MKVTLTLVLLSLVAAQRGGRGGRSGRGGNGGGNGGGNDGGNDRPQPDPRPEPQPDPQPQPQPNQCRALPPLNLTEQCEYAHGGNETAVESCLETFRGRDRIECSANMVRRSRRSRGRDQPQGNVLLAGLEETCTYSGDVCVLTNVFINFLSDPTSFPADAGCDQDFENDAERKLFCQAIKQTVSDFEAIPNFQWNSDYDFPEVCDNDRAPTVCGICRAIRDEFVNTDGSPNYKTLTDKVLDEVITEQEECRSSIRGRDIRNPLEVPFGIHSCNYAFQINSDFSCQTWTDFLANPACTNLSPEECFNLLLTSNLIEGAAIRLYNSSYCEKEMGTYAARILAEVVV